MRLWGIDGTPGPVLRGHKGGVYSVSFSPDGRTIASGSDDKTVRLWGIDGTPRAVLRGHNSRVTSVIFSPDGRTIASGSEDRTVRLWGMCDTTPESSAKRTCLLPPGAADARLPALRFRQLFSQPPSSLLQCSGCTLDGVLNLSPQNRALFEDADRKK
jgi:WD40 repeat protein